MTFVATFQQKYRYCEHPVIPRITHRTYLVVEAPTEEAARAAMNLATTPRDVEITKMVVSDYAFIYPFDDDFVEQIKEYDLIESPFRVVAVNCNCGGEYAWVLNHGMEYLIGCICHHKRSKLKEAIESMERLQAQ